ncbi:hypothetical protein EV191_101760 [Tamaricihabitans halophyticus]|uniref:Peptidase inhibitor family I36 n=1 Tax=Tamaricihabitans halophyticus TaxID=1262583 RepID=A0A4R2R4H6_9PSEU|nr:hypothetical protein [Tamaricihabitans halophyticus]TCP56814.1 hypothetical protein EV191_101760 [Tamaricihabitans halophyticus]
MSRLYRRMFARLGITVGLVLASITFVATPASAHTIGEAVVSPQGCNWSNGGYTQLRRTDLWDNQNNMPLGEVYVLWSGTYQENCIVTLRVGRADGVASYTEAVLERQGMSTIRDEGNYSHFAAAKGKAAGTCIRWTGSIAAIYGGRIHGTTVTEWQHCG